MIPNHLPLPATQKTACLESLALTGSIWELLLPQNILTRLKSKHTHRDAERREREREICHCLLGCLISLRGGQAEARKPIPLLA